MTVFPVVRMTSSHFHQSVVSHGMLRSIELEDITAFPELQMVTIPNVNDITAYSKMQTAFQLLEQRRKHHYIFRSVEDLTASPALQMMSIFPNANDITAYPKLQSPAFQLYKQGKGCQPSF